MKKKLLLTLTLLSLTLGITSVRADELPEGVLSNWYSSMNAYISDVSSTPNSVSSLLDYYNTNYSSSYPFYYIVRNYRNTETWTTLYAFSDNTINSVRAVALDNYVSLGWVVPSTFTNTSFVSMTYKGSSTIDDDGHVTTCQSNYYCLSSIFLPYGSGVGTYRYVASNFNFYFTATSDYSSVRFPYWSSSTYDITYQSFELQDGDIFPSYSTLYNGDYIPSINYTTINLNDYDYVALSLKDYTTNAIDTNFMVQGQLCLTPVYNYGMTEKVSISAGYQVDRCSPVYATSSPVRVSILEQDITNHAIYYLKAYDTSISNIIRIDNALFNITYISSSNANSPSVLIEGRYYPTIPYSQLTSSATISEAEGYVSGQVNNVFDITSDSNVINSIFSNPITALQSAWGSITIMFGIIGQFIALLPLTLQAFLYSAFSLALILGLFKIFIL